MDGPSEKMRELAELVKEWQVERRNYDKTGNYPRWVKVLNRLLLFDVDAALAEADAGYTRIDAIVHELPPVISIRLEQTEAPRP